MIQVRVGGLLPDKKSGNHVLLLKIPNTPKFLPIWIAQNEAQAIAMAMRKEKFARPLTHDLMKSILDGLGAELNHILIHRIEKSTFFARLILSRGDDLVSIDARPSDSVALAVRTGSPIFISEDLLRSQEDSLYQLEHEEKGTADGLEGNTAEFGMELNQLMREVEKGPRGGGDGPAGPEEDQ
ncbi:MAG TPA: bifunctional nuclease family protein [Candidatus Krumholzibacteria bacterium]